MTRSINYKDTLFEQAKLTPIRGEATFEIIHKLRKKIKANANAVYSYLWGGSHGNLFLGLTDVQYALISNTPLFYLTHPVLLIILDGTTAHANSNMWIAHTKEVGIFRKVTGCEQALVQQIVVTVNEAYFADICNRKKTQSTILWRMCSLTSKKTTVGWWLRNSSSSRISSRRQHIIFDTRLGPYFRRQRTSRVLQHHQNILHSTPSL